MELSIYFVLFCFSIWSRALRNPLLVFDFETNCKSLAEGSRPPARGPRRSRLLRRGAGPVLSDVTHHTPPPRYYQCRPPSCPSVWFGGGGVGRLCESVSGRRAGSFVLSVTLWPGPRSPGDFPRAVRRSRSGSPHSRFGPHTREGPSPRHAPQPPPSPFSVAAPRIEFPESDGAP